MKNYSENRKNGLYEPENAIFGPFMMIFSARRMNNSRENKKIRSNKGFQTTTHKLPLYTPFRSLHTYTVQPWVEPEP